MNLSWDLWRHVFSFLDLHDLPTVFCVKFFQPAWQHQQFWITRFLTDFLFREYYILTDYVGDVYRPWPEIREKYQKCVRDRARDFRRIKLEDISISDLGKLPAPSINLWLGTPTCGRRGRPIEITTPVCHFPFGLSNVIGVNEPKCFLSAILPTGSSNGIGSPYAETALIREFHVFLTRLEDQIIKVTAENQWLGSKFSTVESCRDFHRPSVFPANVRYDPQLKLNLIQKKGEIFSKLYDVNGESLAWSDFPRGARGLMAICCQTYFLQPRRAFGVKWYVKELHLTESPDTTQVMQLDQFRFE